MNLLKQQKTFEFFPALNLKTLADKDNEQLHLMSCNMQIPSLSNLNEYTKRNNKNRTIKNIVSKSGDLFFYTGLKQYYKINVKKEILSEYFLEQRKDLLFMDKQTQRRSEYISGDLLFPVRKSYNFNKRRFILTLHTRERLSNNEALVEPFTDIINDLNYSLLGSMLLTAYDSGQLPKFKFYYVAPALNNSGKLYQFLGIDRIFMHKFSVARRHHFVHKGPQQQFRPEKYKIELHLGYILKYLPNRQYYLMQYVLTNFSQKRLINILDINDNHDLKGKSLSLSLLRNLIKEFMAIKMFLRFYLIKYLFFNDPRNTGNRIKPTIKSVVMIFNVVRSIYKNVFEYIFNLCALQLAYISNSANYFLSVPASLNALNLHNVYSANILPYKITIFPLSFLIRSSSKSFENFTKGVITKKIKEDYRFRVERYKSYDKFRFLKGMRFFHKDLANTRYRNILYHRRYNLLVNNNPVYVENQLKKEAEKHLNFSSHHANRTYKNRYKNFKKNNKNTKNGQKR